MPAELPSTEPSLPPGGTEPGVPTEDALRPPTTASSATWVPGLGKELAEPAGASPEPPLPALPGFEMLGLLGQGGMGAVFKARQISLDRLVAIKTISTWAAFRPDARRRFETEAHAVAQIQHPDVVQIYDVGWHEGKPFLVLEYVHGGTLDRQLARRPQPPRAAASAVLRLARAIQAAHERGIIHRDLKPGNILVEQSSWSAAGVAFDLSEARLKITDFGLAKELSGDSGPTLDNETVGTPDYMAPEQALAEHQRIGTRTDVYSLGVILYQMLTGRVPFQGAGALDTLKLVIHEEPVAPRHLVPQIPRDLETICLKCLRKEPNLRYASAAALATDLEAFLNDRPIQARPLAWHERAWRWCRRHPAAAILSLSLVTALATGFTISTVLYLRAERHLEDAHHKFMLAQEAVNLVQSAVGDQLTDSADIPVVRERVLRGLLGFHREFLRERSDDPILRRRAGDAWLRVGDIETWLGNFSNASEAFETGLKLLEELHAAHPKDRLCTFDLATGWKRRGILYSQQGRYGEAEAAYRRARDLCQALLPLDPSHEPTIKLLGDCSNNLGNRLAARGAWAEAEEAFLQAIRLREALVAADPHNQDYRLLSASVQHNLAGLEVRCGRWARAQERLQHNIQQQEHFMAGDAAAPSYRRQLAEAHRELGFVLLYQNQPEPALAALRKSRDLRERLARDFPAIPSYQREWAMANLDLGDVLDSQGQRVQAREPYQMAAQIQSRLTASPSDRRLGMLLRAYEQVNLGQLAPSVSELEAALQADPPDGEAWVLAARILARAAQAATTAEASHLAEGAVKLLRASRGKRYFRGLWQTHDLLWRPEFAALTSRPDFQALMADVRQSQPLPP